MSQKSQEKHENDMILPQDGEQVGACNKSPDTNPMAEEVLSQVSQLETQFASMKELLRKQAILQLEVRRQQAELAQRDEEAAKRQLALVALQEQNAQASEELSRQRQLLAEQEASITAARHQLETEREQIQEAHAAIDASRSELERSRREVESRAADLTAQSHQLLDESVQREAATREREAELVKRLEHIQETLVQAQRAEEELAKKRTELEDIRQDLATQARDILEQRETLQRDQSALQHTQRELEARERELLALAQTVESSKQSLEVRALELRKAADAAEQSAVQQAEQHAEYVTQVQAQVQAQLQAQMQAQLAAQVEAAQSHIKAELEAQLESNFQVKLEAQLQAQKQAHEQELLQAKRETEHLSELLAKQEVQHAADVQQPGASKPPAEVEEVFAEYESLWAFERASVVQIQTELEQAKIDLDHCDGIITGLKERMKQDLEHRRRLEQNIEEIKSQAATTQEALIAAQTSLKAQEQANELLRQAQTSTNSDPADHAKFKQSNTIRQKRLKLYKSLVRQQAMKVRKASEALRKRYEQAEQVLAQRSELAAARLKIIEAQRVLERKSATSRAAVFVLCILCIGTLVGALSWAIAREVAPAKFEAVSIVKAESKERTLNDGELAEWQRLHEDIIEDGRLHEALAERFKRQGIVSLAEASAVGAMTRQNLFFESSSPGELKLRLVSQGAEQTSRILEIFTNGLANFVNSGGVRRVDGATTAISQTATVGASPVDNIRTQYTLGISGIGIAFCSLIGLFIWSRLARAKTAFEQDIRLAETLSD